jgi:hypothetical protein
MQFLMSISLYAVQQNFFRDYSCADVRFIIVVSSEIDIFSFVIYFLLRIRQTYVSHDNQNFLLLLVK